MQISFFLLQFRMRQRDERSKTTFARMVWTNCIAIIQVMWDSFVKFQTKKQFITITQNEEKKEFRAQQWSRISMENEYYEN